MEKGLIEKTGKPLDYWMKVVKDSQIEKHKAIIEFLKSVHGFTHGFANFVSLKTRNADAILDRIVNSSHRIDLKGESLRKGILKNG